MRTATPTYSRSEYLTLREAADRARLSRHTLYKWIETGRLTETRGLRKLGTRRLINWIAFAEAIERGDFANHARTAA